MNLNALQFLKMINLALPKVTTPLIISFFILHVVQAQRTGGPVMTFEKTEIDYGTVDKGSDPYRKFKFKNTGAEPLIIKEAHSTCGCTIPNFKKDPVYPGEWGELTVRYDTQFPGVFNKIISIRTNEAQENRTVTIKGNVLTKGVPGAEGVLAAQKR